MGRTLYDVLEVSRFAPPAEIKRQYRRLAKRYHPDVSDDRSGSDRFLEIQAAYQVLSDPLRRREYDATIRSPVEFRWESPSAYDGPSHKVKMPRGFVDVAHPFRSGSLRTDLWRRTRSERRRRTAARVWTLYVGVVLTLAGALFAYAVSLAASEKGLEAAVSGSGGGMILALLMFAWLAKTNNGAEP